MASEGDHNPQFIAKKGFSNLYDLHFIALAAVNSEDNTFRITTHPDIHDLVESIQQLGLLHPPIVKRHASEYRVISGFRRVAACRQIGWSEIPAYIVSSDTNDDTCALFAIADNSLQRPLNLVEISRSLYLLSSYFNDENLQLRYASKLGLSEHHTHIKKIKKICRLPKPIQDSILKGTISLAVALELFKFEPEAGVALATLFDQLNIGLNKQRQLIVLLSEIGLRENTSIENLLNEKELRKILDYKELDRVQKSQQIKNYLNQRRYPTIVSTKNEFNKHIKDLKLGNSITLAPPRDFEGTTYTLTLRFSSHAELADLKSKLDRIIRSSGLKEFLNGTME
jgi:ParB family chromosome partitioning protein